jgi:hypothetical protein
MLLAMGLPLAGKASAASPDPQYPPVVCAPKQTPTYLIPCMDRAQFEGMTPSGGVVVAENSTSPTTFTATRPSTRYFWNIFTDSSFAYSAHSPTGCGPTDNFCNVWPRQRIHEEWVYDVISESTTGASSWLISAPNPVATPMVPDFTAVATPSAQSPTEWTFDATSMVGPVDSLGKDWGFARHYDWDFGGGLPFLDGPAKVTSRFPKPGTYTVKMTAKFNYKICCGSGTSRNLLATISKTIVVKPVELAASVKVEELDKSKGEYRFLADIANGSNLATAKWTIDGKAAGTELTLNKTFATPGKHSVVLTVTDGAKTVDGEAQIDVEAPKLDVKIANDDGTTNLRLAQGKAITLRITVSSSAGGVGSLNEVHIDPAGLLVLGNENQVELVGPSKPLATSVFDLATGKSRSFVQEVRAKKDSASGPVEVKSSWVAKDDAGQVVDGNGVETLRIDAEDITVKITTDPSVFTLAETAQGVTPRTVIVTADITNNLNRAITNVTIDDKATLKRWKNLPAPVPFPVEVIQNATPSKNIGQIGAGEKRTITYKLSVTDDLGFEVGALVLGADSVGGARVTGLGAATVEAKPKYLLRLETRVASPTSGLLPAGNDIVLRGEARNATNTVKLDLGPLLPTAEGNAGLMSISSTGDPANPRDLPPPEVWTLEENSTEKRFGVRVTTAYSEPALADEPPRGGTRATLTFTPWGKVTLEDGTEKELKPTDILTIGENTHRVSIDDSVAIPETSYALLAGAVSVGVIEGVYSFVASIPTMIKELVKLPYTILHAAVEFQSEVWTAFTPEEKEQFSRDVSYSAALVLVRNVEFGSRKFQDVWDQVNAETLAKLTQAQNQWETGDYASTAQMYSRFASEQIAGVVLPIAFGKLTKSGTAAAALERESALVQEEMAPVLARAAEAESIPEIASSLSEIEGGTALVPEAVATLGGIAVDESAALQSIADDSNFVLTVRSRHASSIDWIKRFLAVVKPEAIKIKCVNEIDVLLGYNPEHIGSVVFKQPAAFLEAQRSGESVFQAIDRQLANQGIRPGNPQYLKALVRLESRQKEWQKYEKLYKSWNKQKWIDVGYNYKDNGITSKLRVNRPQARGFRLQAVDGATEEYIVQLRDSGHQWRPITGDIDGVTFTHADGSALTEKEHLWLLEKIRKNPLLAGQHGESGTFIKGGVGFIEDNLKGEAGIQFAPHQPVRAVKFNAKKSLWKSPNEYYLHWDGGYIHSGGRPKVPTVTPVLPDLDQLVRNPEKALAPVSLSPALPGGTASNPGQFGRCRLRFGNSPGAKVLRMRADGVVFERVAGKWNPTTLAESCFADGPLVTIEVVPSTTTTGNTNATDQRVAVSQNPGGDPTNANPDGFQVGQQVTLDPGGPNEEVANISGFGSLIFQEPLRNAHVAGELIIVSAQSVASVATSTTSPTTLPTPSSTVPGSLVFPAIVVPSNTSAVASTTIAPLGSGGSAPPSSVPPPSSVTQSAGANNSSTTSLVPALKASTELGAGLPAAPAPLAAPEQTVGQSVAYTGSSGNVGWAGLAILALGLLLNLLARRRLRSCHS